MCSLMTKVMDLMKVHGINTTAEFKQELDELLNPKTHKEIEIETAIKNLRHMFQAYKLRQGLIDSLELKSTHKYITITNIMDMGRDWCTVLNEQEPEWDGTDVCFLIDDLINVCPDCHLIYCCCDD